MSRTIYMHSRVCKLFISCIVSQTKLWCEQLDNWVFVTTVHILIQTSLSLYELDMYVVLWHTKVVVLSSYMIDMAQENKLLVFCIMINIDPRYYLPDINNTNRKSMYQIL